MFSKNPPNVDPARLAPRELDLEKLLWSGKPLKSFFSVESSLSPVLNFGTKEDWRAFYNNNCPCERLIGFIDNVVTKKKIVDSKDEQDDDDISKVDMRIRGYINHAYYQA